ncbi:MAG: 50S ribosomal protein L23 [Patescibacteria group bacterium]
MSKENMAIFDIFKKRKEKERYENKRKTKGASEGVPEKIISDKKDAKEPEKKFNLSEKSIAPDVLIGPHITEKATFLNEGNVYVFEIKPKSNKIMVKQAIKELYGVAPKKIRIINSPSKTRFFRGQKGEKSGYKKAMVYLKEGDKIEV